MTAPVTASIRRVLEHVPAPIPRRKCDRSMRPRQALIALAAGAALSLVAPAARAMSIERVVSPGGIEAWLVRDRTVPLIALEFAMRGSADQDPPGLPGVAELATSLLDEGAGRLDARTFHERLERKAIELESRLRLLQDADGDIHSDDFGELRIRK